MRLLRHQSAKLRKATTSVVTGEHGFGLVEAMITVAIMSMVAVQYAAMMTNQANNEARQKFWMNANTLNDEIRATLSTPAACYTSLGNGASVQAGSDLFPTQIGDTANNYKVGGTYGLNSVKIKSMELNSYVQNATNPTQAQMLLTLKYSPTVAKGSDHSLTIPISIDLGAGGKILSCMPQSKMTDGIWQRPTANLNNIYFSGPLAASGTPGFVGIGTDQPAQQLDIHADSTTMNPLQNGLVISGKATAPNMGHAISFMQNSTTARASYISSVVDPTGKGSELHFGTTPTFGTAATRNMTLDKDGNLGIGTPSPTAVLDVRGGAFFEAPIAGPNAVFALTVLGDSIIGSKTGSYVKLTPQDKWPYSLLTAFTSMNQVGLMHTDGKVKLGTWVGGAVGNQVGQVGTFSNHPFQLFSNNTNAVTIWQDQRVMIHNRMAIGSVFKGSAVLSVGGDVYSEGEIHANGNVTANGYVIANSAAYSDARLKRNVEPLNDALEQIMKLNGVSYYWKDPKRGNSLQLGLIAQDVAKVYPSAVIDTQDGYKALLYTSLIAPIIESIKSLYAKMMLIDSRVQTLESELIVAKKELANVRAEALIKEQKLMDRLDRLEKLADKAQ